MAKGKNARKRANRRAAVQSVANAPALAVRDSISRALDGAYNPRRLEQLIDIEDGLKSNQKFGRRFSSRKQFKRLFCRTLDFSKYPVTGLPEVKASQRLTDTNNHYVQCHEIEQQRELTYLTKLLNKKLSEKPPRWDFEEVTDPITGEYKDIKKDNLPKLVEWEKDIQAIRARIQDRPRVSILGRAGAITELQFDGTVKEIPLVKVMEPNAHPATARIQRPAWNKDEVIVPIDMTGMKSTIFSPLRKVANSHRKEIPLSLALWMICKQEGLDAYKLYGVTDMDAEEMLEKLHERN